MIPLRRVQNTGEKHRLLDIRWKKKFTSVINPFFWLNGIRDLVSFSRGRDASTVSTRTILRKNSKRPIGMKWNEMFNFLRKVKSNWEKEKLRRYSEEEKIVGYNWVVSPVSFSFRWRRRHKTLLLPKWKISERSLPFIRLNECAASSSPCLTLLNIPTRRKEYYAKWKRVYHPANGDYRAIIGGNWRRKCNRVNHTDASIV